MFASNMAAIHMRETHEMSPPALSHIVCVREMFLNSWTDEEFRGVLILQDRISFPKVLFCVKPAKEENMFLSLSPKDGAVAKGENRLFKHAHIHKVPHCAARL